MSQMEMSDVPECATKFNKSDNEKCERRVVICTRCATPVPEATHGNHAVCEHCGLNMVVFGNRLHTWDARAITTDSIVSDLRRLGDADPDTVRSYAYKRYCDRGAERIDALGRENEKLHTKLKASESKLETSRDIAQNVIARLRDVVNPRR